MYIKILTQRHLQFTCLPTKMQRLDIRITLSAVLYFCTCLITYADKALLQFFIRARTKETKIDSRSLFGVLANWYLLVDN